MTQRLHLVDFFRIYLTFFVFVIKYKVIEKFKLGEIFLRVISGSARGKKLLCTDGKNVRPTLDRVKESVFNMIAFDIPDSLVLDLFSGSGALGIEALSRGAKQCTFVDNSPQSILVTKKNLESTHLLDESIVINSDSIDFLNKCDKKFDIIFIDPPYETDLYQKSLKKIKENGLLNNNGFIILEYDTETTPPFDFCGFEVFKEKQYGRVKILLMKE